MERLGNLIFEVANSWFNQQCYSFNRNPNNYYCSLFECQNPDTAFHPEFRDGNAYWVCYITTDNGKTWQDVELSIPKWLYDMYMESKINIISRGLVIVHELEAA